MKKTIDTAELGRKMMLYSPNIINDTEFNNWCRLAPKLIGMGISTYPKNINELSEQELAIANRAYILLISKGELIVK